MFGLQKLILSITYLIKVFVLPSGLCLSIIDDPEALGGDLLIFEPIKISVFSQKNQSNEEALRKNAISRTLKTSTNSVNYKRIKSIVRGRKSILLKDLKYFRIAKYFE